MARWEPNARGRLRDAALELYGERGYEQTTVADIAERAGVTSRTFFRHFADKREVLFSGTEALEQGMVDALASAPASASAMDAVAAALDAAAELIGGNREFSRARQAVIDSSAELRERELIKMATLAAALTDGLRARGVGDPQAGLAAETGVAGFRVAWAQWMGEATDRPLIDVMRAALAQLREVLPAAQAVR